MGRDLGNECPEHRVSKGRRRSSKSSSRIGCSILREGETSRGRSSCSWVLTMGVLVLARAATCNAFRTLVRPTTAAAGRRLSVAAGLSTSRPHSTAVATAAGGGGGGGFGRMGNRHQFGGGRSSSSGRKSTSDDVGAEIGEGWAMHPGPAEHSDGRTSSVGTVAPHSADTMEDHPRRITGENHIFCNREINLSKMQAVGFDMDYTLAQYYSSFDLLAFDGAKAKMVNELNYPEAVMDFPYNPTAFTRGLVIDKERGNFIKMDRHKYVRVAHHGYRRLKSEERKAIYQSSFSTQNTAFTGANFVNMDTLFSLVDACLFARLVNYKDEHPDVLPQSYASLYRDVRKCVDVCHRDGVIKDRVAEDPAKYIMPDPDMVPMLKRLKEEGIKVFLLTNSLWDYTNVVMNFLVGNDKEHRNTEWVDMFDMVVVGACKPGFLADPYLTLFRVDTERDMLRNTDGVIGSDVAKFLEEGRVFQGGNWLHLHEMLSLSSGDQLLYVGDHMFSDIVKSKRAVGWRTCLIVPELEREVKTLYDNLELRKRITELRNLQYDLDDWADTLRLRRSRAEKAGNLDYLPTNQRQLEEMSAQQRTVKSLLAQKSLKFHRSFHPTWGQLFKSGYQDSRFSQQVTMYACLYTSRATNLLQISASRSFRPPGDSSPHDAMLEMEPQLDPDPSRRLHQLQQGEGTGDRAGVGGAGQGGGGGGGGK